MKMKISLLLSISGVSWSFRFTSQKRKMVISSSLPHLEIVDWLQRLDLQIYEEKFKRFSGVGELIEFSERDIKNLGVKNSSHRARMISSLVALKGERFFLWIFHFPKARTRKLKALKLNSISTKPFGVAKKSAKLPRMQRFHHIAAR